MLNDLINKIDKQFTLLDYVIIDETQWKRIKKLIKDAQKIKESDELRAAKNF